MTSSTKSIEAAAGDAQVLAERIARWMLSRGLAAHLNMTLLRVSPGAVTLGMSVGATTLNMVGVAHGGASFALADTAFGIASNSRGQTAVSLSATMAYPAAASQGDTLEAEAVEEALSRRTGNYRVTVRRCSDGRVVGLFHGVVFRRDDSVEEWLVRDGY
ncbi:MAG: hotdog fold thioesterase [Magnetococcus sp. WYHC-3]